MATLHPTRRVLALMPSYVQKFACIGSECEDTCCAGWTVAIDKKTYKAYRHAPKTSLSGRLPAAVKRLSDSVSAANFGYIDLVPETGACPLLEQQLCAVHSQLGEEHLSHNCFSYPRKWLHADGVMLQTLTLSCPQAARLALLADDAFEMVESEITVRPSAVGQLLPQHGLSVEQMNEVRFLCVQIIRTEGLDLWQKLAVVGVFCDSLTQALNAGQQASIAEICNTTRDYIVSGQVLGLCDSIVAHADLQALTFNLLWRFGKTIHMRPTHRAVFAAIEAGLSIGAAAGEAKEDALIARYQSGLALLPQALAKAPAFLDNYVLNEMLRDTFPFGAECTRPNEHYLRLVTRFGLLRFMLAVQCIPDTALPELADMVSTVQVFARRFQHDSEFANKVNNCFHEAGLESLGKIFILLKP